MDDRLEAEMEALLQKYAGGRMPPLVDMDNPRSGLVDGELLKIFHTGLLAKNIVLPGILLPARHYRSLDEKWRNGDYSLIDWSKVTWVSFTKALRATPEGDKACDDCDRRRAIMAERERQVIAYLCDNGMIDFAMPVSVMDQVVAVLFSGQCRPQAGSTWNPEFIQPDGCFRPLAPGESGVDAWGESQRRIREIEQRAGFREGALLWYLSDDVNPVPQVSPQDVEEKMGLLKSTGEQLSSLATSTFELEKNKLVGWVRSQIAGSLVPLSIAPAETKAVWERLSLGLGCMTRYLGLDYALIFSWFEKEEEGIRVLCQSGLPEADFLRGEAVPISKELLSRLRSATREQKEPFPLSLRAYTDLPVFDRLHRLHARRKSDKALAIPILAPSETVPSTMLLGRFDRDIDLDTCSPENRAALPLIIADVRMVLEIILLVEQLRETARRQTLFVEDVAHDIRNPIQNIIVMADALTRGLVPPEEIPHRARSLAAQARRLHMMSERMWVLESIDRGRFFPEEVETVNVYQILMECRKSLLDLADRRNIKIYIDQELDRWSPIQVNKGLFVQTALNLIDNAIKYSRERTEVRIDGRRLPDGVTLSFVNRGVRIRDEDRERIYERYWRTKEAKQHVQEGTGIGLSIVKAFADYYGAVEVKSTPVQGTQDYVTEFRLFIWERG